MSACKISVAGLALWLFLTSTAQAIDLGTFMGGAPVPTPVPAPPACTLVASKNPFVAGVDTITVTLLDANGVSITTAQSVAAYTATGYKAKSGVVFPVSGITSSAKGQLTIYLTTPGLQSCSITLVAQ